jgi:hypothetical protein
MAPESKLPAWAPCHLDPGVSRRSLILLLILMVFLRPALGFGARQKAKAEVRASTTSPTYENTKPGVAYVGSGVCAECHKDIYEQFVRTDMGHSMSLANIPSQLALVRNPVEIYDKQIGQYFRVFRQGSDLYQEEFGRDSSGRVTFRHPERIAYVVGTGENGFSYLIRRGDYLFQAPLSYYSKPQAWGLSPAHEMGFNRPIEVGCIVCHTGRARPVPNQEALYKQPPFEELSIGCEDCHGPGQLHVDQRRKEEALSGEVDRSIANPADLPAWLADNICMSCHELGDSRVLQPGKHYLDFRPGTPLDDTLAIFKIPLRKDAAAQSPLLNHYFLMTLSKCYQKSGGRLSCLSCHDPHYQPSVQEAPAYYRQKCLACHTDGSCSLPLEARIGKAPFDDCIGCHMPKQPLTTIAHSALTDHRITAREGEPYPAAAFRPTTAQLPGLIHLSAQPGKESEAIPPLTRLLAYNDAMESDPSYKDLYETSLREIAKSQPNDPYVEVMLARNALQTNSPAADEQAINHLLRAINLGLTLPADYDLLATLLIRSRRFADAICVARKGLALSPYSSSFYAELGVCYEGLGQIREAVEILQQGSRLFPEEPTIQELLRKISSQSTEH